MLRHYKKYKFVLAILFQSTLPRGSDDCTPSRAQAFCHTFQSTLPHGSDAERPAQYAVKCYFIPRSLAGATLILFGYDFKSDHFNPRSLAGTTCCFSGASMPARHFNPRSLAGATYASCIRGAAAEFQSTLPHGSDG